MDQNCSILITTFLYLFFFLLVSYAELKNMWPIGQQPAKNWGDTEKWPEEPRAARGLPTKGRTRSQSEHVCVWIVHHIHNGHDRPKNEGSEEHAQNHSFSYLSRVQIDKTLSRCINVPIVLCYSIIKQPVQAELKCWGMSLPNKHKTDFSSWRQTSLEKSCQLFSGFLPLGCA